MKRNWLIAAILTALLALALFGVRLVAAAGACGDGLAAQDLAGVCRAATPTPGALEAVTPRIPPKPHGVELVPIP